MESALPNAASDLLYQGFELMLVGMGTVFVFLTLLVVATQIMSMLVLRKENPGKGDQATPQEVAAIAAAIQLHRRRA